MTFQQMNTGYLFATWQLCHAYDLSNAKAWGRAKPRTSAEISEYCDKMMSESEIQDFYKTFFNFDGVTA